VRISSSFFNAIPAFVFLTVNLSAAPIPKLSPSSFVMVMRTGGMDEEYPEWHGTIFSKRNMCYDLISTG
jgi:hypothetical protein